MSKQKKLGIIAGGGAIPKMLIEHCRVTSRDFFVIAIKNNANEDLIFADDIPHMWVSIGKSAEGFNRLKEENVEEVVMIGTINRPTLSDLIPDFRTAKFFINVARKALGDDGILRAAIKEFEKDGFQVKGIHDVLPEILVPDGILGKHKVDKQALTDIKKGVEIATELGKMDVGQAVVVQQGLVLAVEGIEGTDKLIERSKDYHRKGVGGILVKLRKPQQDMRVDLPTIGPKTIESAYKAGLRGIAIHSGNALIVDLEKTIELANKNKIFVIGINPKDYK
jgi:DUF1009 family protein